MTPPFDGRYRAFGLSLQSTLPLPELAPDDATAADVAVRFAALDRPAGLVPLLAGLAAGPGTAWLEVPDIIRLLVTDRETIRIERLGGASDAALRAYVLGTGIAALLYQRAQMPLHAGAVRLGGGAVAFCGASGAGKSTMVHHFHRRGHAVLGDDLCSIALSPTGPVTWSGVRGVKLWGQTLAAIGASPAGHEPVMPAIDKYRVPLPTDPAGPVALTAIVELVAGTGAPRVEAVTGAAAAALLLKHSFRGLLVEPMGLTGRHVGLCLAIARSCRVLRLVRPLDFAALDATVAVVRQAVEG